MVGSNEKRTLNIRALLTDEISKQLTGISKEIKRGADATENANKRASSSWKKVAAGIASVVAAVGVYKAVGLARQLASETDQIGKLAIAAGINVETFSELGAAFQFAGGNAEQFRSVLSALLSAQRGALKGSKEQVAAFDALGISSGKLRTLSPDGVLLELAKGYERIDDATTRTLVFSQLFPEQWRNVINLVQGGAEAFNARLKEARTSGATVTREQARAAALITDAFYKVDLAVKSVTRELLVAFGPGVVTVLQTFSKTLLNNKQLIIDVAIVIKDVFVSALDLASKAVIGLVATIESIPSVNLLTSGLESNIDAIDKRIDNLIKKSLAAGSVVTAQSRALFIRLAKDGDDVFSKQLTSLVGQFQKLKAELAAAGDETLADRLRQMKSGVAAEADALVEAIKQANSKVSSQGLSDPSSPLNIWTEVDNTFRDREGLARMQVAAENAGNLFVDAFNLSVGSRLQKFGKVFAEFVTESVKAVEKIADPVPAQSFASAWIQSLERVKDSLRSVQNLAAALGQGLARITESSLNALSDELANVITGAKTAKEAWKDFLTTSLQLIAKLIAKLAVLKVAQLVTGGAGVALAKGGVLPGVSSDSGSLPTKKYAKGGVAKRPQLAVFGEGDRNEAFVPLPDNRSIPVSFTGGGPSGGGGVVNVNIYALDSKSVADALVTNQETLKAIWQTQASSQQGVRQTIRQASR
jgi:hypothetical protein